MSYIITVSPKGQITIPSKERKKMVSKKYLLEVKGKTFILKPVKIELIDDDTAHFGLLSESSFADVWDNPEDDIYQEFYSDKKKKK